MRKGTPVTAVLILLLSAIASQASAQGLPDFTGIVEKVGPAVVNIEARHSAGSPGSAPNRENQDEFQEFFRRYFGQPNPRQMPERVSGGSGFFISDDGYLLTNQHVVDGADEIIVRLNDRQEFSAELIGSDEQTDIALLKVDGDGFPHLKFGNSETLKPGEWVLAIGSPFGFDYSVTAGIISAKGRSFVGQQYVPFLQTDVAINRGNSGGPLLSLDGNVIGINSQIFSSTGGYMGLSFAIPSEVAQQVTRQLRTEGRVARGWLGVGIQTLSQDLARTFGMDQARGALVNQVEPGSAAADAGLREGDVILEFGGAEVETSAALPPLVGATPPGTAVDVEVLREGRRQTLEVTIGELEVSDSDGPDNASQPNGGESRLGFSVAPIEDNVREALGIEEGGVLVSEVTSPSARRAGLRAGDVVMRVNNEEIGSVDDFENALEDLEAGENVALLVRGTNGSRFVVIEVGGEE